MPTIKILTTKKAVIDGMIKRYMAQKPNLPACQQFDELENVYKKYQKTRDISVLHYLFALCLRIRHGRRMPWIDTRKAVDKLVESDILTHHFSDFEKIHKEVESILSGIHFVQGTLMVYDTALTIGSLLGVHPQKLIYLYAGAWDGAVILKGPKIIQHVMDVCLWQAPSLFPGIDSMDIENMLCDLKSLFKKLNDTGVVTTDDIDKRLKPGKCPPFKKDEALKKMGFIK